MKTILFLSFMILSSPDSINVSSEIKTWEDVVFTSSTKDIIGLVQLEEIDITVKKLMTTPKKLKEEAHELAKKKAFELGATHILIAFDHHLWDPSRYVVTGIAYK